MANYEFEGPDGKTYVFEGPDQPSAPSAPQTPGLNPAESLMGAIKANPLEVAKIAVSTPLEAIGKANQGLRALGVGAQHLIQGDSNTLERSAAAAQPGFVPQKGERIGAVAGPALPMLAVGGPLAAAGLAGAASAGEKLNEGAGLPEAALTGAKDAAISYAAGKALPALAGSAKRAGIALAKKSFGFSTAAIKRLGVEGTKDIAETLANAKVIDPLGRRSVTAVRVKSLLDKTGEEIGNILDGSSATIQPQELAKTLEQKLTPKYQGPLFEKQVQVAKDIADTVRGLGDQPVSLRTLHDIRRTIAQKAKFNNLTDTESSKLFEKAYGALSDELSGALKSADPATFTKFKGLNKVFNAAKEGSQAISARVAASEAKEPGISLGLGNLAGDVATSLPGAASRALGTGNVVSGLTSLAPKTSRVARSIASPLVRALTGEDKRKEK
jgi:hypothetical protein